MVRELSAFEKYLADRLLARGSEENNKGIPASKRVSSPRHKAPRAIPPARHEARRALSPIRRRSPRRVLSPLRGEAPCAPSSHRDAHRQFSPRHKAHSAKGAHFKRDRCSNCLRYGHRKENCNHRNGYMRCSKCGQRRGNNHKCNGRMDVD